MFYPGSSPAGRAYRVLSKIRAVPLFFTLLAALCLATGCHVRFDKDGEDKKTLRSLVAGLPQTPGVPCGGDQRLYSIQILIFSSALTTSLLGRWLEGVRRGKSWIVLSGLYSLVFWPLRESARY